MLEVVHSDEYLKLIKNVKQNFEDKKSAHKHNGNKLKANKCKDNTTQQYACQCVKQMMESAKHKVHCIKREFEARE